MSPNGKLRDKAERAVRAMLSDMERRNVSVLQRSDPYAIVGPDGVPRATLAEVIDCFVAALTRRQP